MKTMIFTSRASDATGHCSISKNLGCHWLTAAAASLLLGLSMSAQAVPTQLNFDENGFVGWAPGIPHQTSSSSAEEANVPAARAVAGASYVAGSFVVTSLRPETSGITQANTMDIDATLHFNSSLPVTQGAVAIRNFNVLGFSAVISDTLTVTFTGLANNEVSLDAHFNSDSLSDFITPFTLNFANIAGIDESRNVSLDALFGSTWLPGAAEGFNLSVSDIDVQFRSDGAVPEPSAYGLLGAAALLVIAMRRRFASRTKAA